MSSELARLMYEQIVQAIMEGIMNPTDADCEDGGGSVSIMALAATRKVMPIITAHENAIWEQAREQAATLAEQWSEHETDDIVGLVIARDIRAMRRE